MTASQGTTGINARHNKSIEVLREELVVVWIPYRHNTEKSTLTREITTSANRIVEHWKYHEKKRDADIEAAHFLTSLKDHTHSYGKFALFEKCKFGDFALNVKRKTAFTFIVSRMHHRNQC